jgi:hypothetical protein
MMAINPEHLGAQVQCPHCQAVVQTPAAAPAMPEPVFVQPPALGAAERDSIFGQPEPTEDLFGGGAANIEIPKLEMPPPPRVSEATVTVQQEFQPPAAPPPITEAIAEGPPVDLGTLAPPRRPPPPSNLAPILLIFLVPYAIFTTAFIGYLLYTWPRDNPLKNLPDIGPKGQPRFQVKHDYELDPSMKTALGQPIRVGAIEVTPLKVKHTPENDLVLVFRAKNVSTNQVFNPIADEYMKFSRKTMDRGMPYTFLERLHRDKLARIYGGNLEWYQNGRQVPGGFDIGPGEEATIHLISELDYRKREVTNFLAAKERLVWRVQVRQGFVNVEGKDVSATTVIGIEFTARDIVSQKSG